MLLSVTIQESFLALSDTFDMVHRMCPTAYMIVIGTKADLRTSTSVTPEEAEVSNSVHVVSFEKWALYQSIFFDLLQLFNSTRCIHVYLLSYSVFNSLYTCISAQLFCIQLTVYMYICSVIL